jgi:hypothetical protein
MLTCEVHIKLYSDDQSKPCVLVGFEHGMPDYDYDRQCSFRRG